MLLSTLKVNSSEPDVSLVIPVYNGSGLLEKNLTPFLEYLKARPYWVQLILVDDGSQDWVKTKAYAERNGLIYIQQRPNQGKGYALKLGFERAVGKICIFTDADIPFQYGNFDKLVEKLNNDPEQLVIGDRTLPDSVYFEKTGFLRKLGSALVVRMAHAMLFKTHCDTQCGLKGGGGSVMKTLFSNSMINGFAIDIELIYLAIRFNIKIGKIPVQLRYNDSTSVNIFLHGIQLLKDIYRIRKYHKNTEFYVRKGDKVHIEGGYQFNAYYHGILCQRYWHKFKVRSALDNLSIEPGMKVLDAGCGSGVLTAIVAQENPDVTAIGIDGNVDAIAFCHSKWRYLENASFLNMKIDELSALEDSTIDRIAFLEVLEHITPFQAKWVLKEFNRILSPEGFLVVSTPNRRSFWPVQEFLIDLFQLAPKLKGDQHEKLYSSKELEEVTKSNGFIVVKKQKINFLAPWVAVLSQSLAKWFHTVELKNTWIPGSLLLFTFKKQVKKI